MTHVPPGAAALTAYVCPRRCAEAIDWYAEVLGAHELGSRFVDPDGRVGHAEIDLGGTVLMLSDAYPDYDTVAPTEGATTTAFALHLYVPDVDATFALACERGAEARRPVEDQFDGSRRGTLVDPFGVRWMLSTQVRDLSAHELDAAVDDFAARGADPRSAV